MKTAYKPFIKPKKLDCDRKALTELYGKFVAEPFERGFGTTIGNSLRRHLLSSIEGSAITAVKFGGVYHEFSTLPGVYEDISDIILNLKEVIVKKHVGEPRTISIDITGHKKVTAGDIDCGPDVEVLNKDHHIATLTGKDSKLKMELVVASGRGYSPSEANMPEDADMSMIPIDAAFSPVKNVTFKVESTRVGQSSDYDKLILEITTNGAITPEEALTHSARILKDHLSIFIMYGEETESATPEVDVEKMKIAANLRKSVEELELSVRAYNCLKTANIETIHELVQKTDQEMLRTRNFGRKSLNEIKDILHSMGLHLGMDVKLYENELKALESKTAVI